MERLIIKAKLDFTGRGGEQRKQALEAALHEMFVKLDREYEMKWVKIGQPGRPKKGGES